MFRTLLPALALVATPALADMNEKTSDRDVTDTMDRLESAVTSAGATVFARVDHAQGATDAGMYLPDAQLLIFGNPQIGTLAMQDDPRAGLYLPMKVLVYDDEGTTRVVWQDPEEMFDEIDIDDDADYLAKMDEALGKLTDAATQ